MTSDIRVLSITPIEYYRRMVRMVNENTGQQRELVYGDSVTEAVIRRRAPLLWRSAKPINNEKENVQCTKAQ